MKTVIQRVGRASVTAEGKIAGQIDGGFLILAGIAQTDTEDEIRLMAAKIANLRVFSDEEDKMNLSLLDTELSALVVSNFTLCADTKKGNRPSFTPAMKPPQAEDLYELFCSELKANGIKKVEKGLFGADMKVELLNDGPITFVLDTDLWRRK